MNVMAKAPPVNPVKYIVEREVNGNSFKRDLFKSRLAGAKNLYKKDLLEHYGCVNAIEFSDEGELLVSGGDDRRVLLWSIPQAIYGKCKPVAMRTNHDSNIFCLAFDSSNSRIFSGGNDDQVIVHEISTGQAVVKLSHKKPVYGLSVNPQNDKVIATAGDDGRVLIYDIREPELQCLAKHKVGFHSVMYNSQNPALLVTANSEEGIELWDARKPKEVLIHYDEDAGHISGISACFNANGSRVLALRRRLPPVLYETQDKNALCQFYHPHYYNSCTMKTCRFAGEDDEYVLSGSDDFNLYSWRIPPENVEWGHSHLVLRGHRSIVNQVRYNKQNNIIASSGVEKMIKLWSSLNIGTWSGSLEKDTCDPQRIVYSHEDYVYLVGHAGQRISHDYSDHSTTEDARMMAFFDSLIQREIEGWESQSETTFTSDSDSDTHVQDKIRFSWQSLLRGRKMAEESCKKHRPNRIAQLIAQKRNKLAKMAHWKSSTLVQRSTSREKHKKRKSQLEYRKSTKAKSGKFSSSSSSHHHQPSTQSSRRLASSSSSSSKHSAHHHHKSSRAHSPTTQNTSEKENYMEHRVRHKRFRKSSTGRDHDHQNQSIDVPSTSTGITGSSNPVFRLIEQDSDEEMIPSSQHAANLINCEAASRSATQENLINILPTPLNGSQDMYINVLEVSNTNVVPLMTRSNAEYASTSYDNYASSLSDSEYEILTPAKQQLPPSSRSSRQPDSCEVDSGFATSGPCSSKQRNHHSRCDSSDEDYTNKYEKFRKRVKKARLNIRQQIGIDSDSN